MNNTIEQSFWWVSSCIKSSSNGWQFKACATLIELYDAMYKDNSGEYSAGNLTETLRLQELKFSVEV